MGNKRRKATLIIVSVLTFLTALFAALLPLFPELGPKNVNVEAATTITTSTDGLNGTYNFSGTFVLINFAPDGQGSSGTHYGYGSATISFVKDANNISIYPGSSTGGGTGAKKGGGRTTSYANWGLPSGSSAGASYAAGGGGGGTSGGSTDKYSNAAFATHDSTDGKTYGRGATQSTGYTANASGANVGQYGAWVNALGGGGGTGYKDGEGGKTTSGSVGYPGGGGVCSPNSYPVYGQDTYYGTASCSGFVNAHRLSYGTIPSSKSDTSGSGSSVAINAGGGWTTEVYITKGGSKLFDLSTYLKFGWAYSADKVSWYSSPASVANTTKGTSKAVYCRFVMYGASTDVKCVSYKMKYTSVTAAAADTGYTIYETICYAYLYGNASIASTPEANSLTYTGKAQNLVTTGSANNGTVYYRWATEDNTSKASSWSTSVPTGTNAGTYYVWYYVSGKTYYNDTAASSSIKVTIGKAAPTLSPPSYSDLTYTGAAQQLLKSSGSASGGGAITYKVDGGSTISSYTEVKGTAAKSYKITYTSAESSNYKSGSGEVTVTINKAAISFAGAVLPTGFGEKENVLRYNGSSQSLIRSKGESANGTFAYTTTITSAFATDATGTTPQKYTVYYKLVPKDTTNYDDSVIMSFESWIINGLASVQAAPTVATGLTYKGGSAIQLLKTAGTAVNGSFRYKVGTATKTSEITETDWTKITGKDAITYTISYYVLGNTHYDSTEIKPLTVTIANATASINTHPTGKSGLSYTTEALSLLASAGGCTGGSIVYKLSTETSWKSVYSEVKAINAGTYTVQYKVSPATYYDESAVSSLTVTIAKANASVSVAPVKYTNLKYTGSAQSLLEKAGTAVGGTLKYKLSTATTWTKTYSDVKATDPATYTVQYWVDSSEGKDSNADFSVNYVSTSSTSPYTTTVTIAAGDQTIKPNNLAARTLTYTGSAQQLYTGAASLTAPGSKTGTIYYGYSTSSSTTPSAENTVVTNLTATDAYNANGQITYYLWYRVSNNGIYTNAIAWTYTGVSLKMKKATYTVTVSSNSDVTYDGQSHDIYSGSPTPKSDSGAPNELLTVKYKLVYTGYNGYVYNFTETETPDVTLKSVMNAGTYVLSATWAAASSTDYSINTGSATYKTFTINKSDAYNKVEVSGLTYSNTYELDEDASAYPFKSKTPSLELTAFGQTEHNGITLDSNNYGGYNKLRIALVQGVEYATKAPDDKAFSAAYETAAALNKAIAALAVHDSNRWYLWLKVSTHNSLTTGSTILAAEFQVEAFNDAMVNLTGLAMTGANGVIGIDGYTPYKAAPYNLVASGDGVDASQSALKGHLGKVQYAWSTSSNNTVRPSLQNIWNDSPYAFEQTNVGTYYLWVKWDGSTKIRPNSGVIYASMTITQLSNANSNFYFGGISMTNDWGSPDTTSTTSLTTYKRTFDNNDYLITKNTIKDIQAYANNGTIDIVKDLTGTIGALSVGISTSPTNMNGQDYFENFSSLKIKNFGIYYLWVRWPGSANVAAGQAVYMLQSSKTTLQFLMQQLTDANEDINIDITNRGDVRYVDNGNKEYPYKYEFLLSGNNGNFRGLQQPLFATDNPLTVSIGYQVYNASSVVLKYLLSTESTGVTPNRGNWANSIDLATQEDVGKYYLWIWVSIDDANAKIDKTFQVFQPADIVAADSYVRIAPQPVLNLFFEDRLLTLIVPSGQLQPKVEYAIGRYNEDTREWVIDEGAWSTDVNSEALQRKEAGVYRVYYRGAAFENKFRTEPEPQNGYPYIEVTITQSSANIQTYPKAKNVTFTGSPLETFERGYAQGGGKTGIKLEYSWDGRDFYYYESLEKKVNAGTYTLWFRPDTNDPNFNKDEIDTLTMTVNIAKAEIRVKIGFTMSGEELIYSATDYQLFVTPVDFYMVDANGDELIDSNGVHLSYLNYLEENKKEISKWINGGKLGAIYYAVTTDPNIYPNNDEWVTDIAKATARQVGSYYIWVKVDAGDNHLFSAATCYNPGQPIRIVAAGNEDVRFTNTTFTASKENGGYFHYTGLGRTLVNQLNLVIEVRERDNYGDLTDQWKTIYNETYKQNDYTGQILYALGVGPKDFPTDHDIGNNEYSWQTSYLVLTRINAGDYYLLIMISEDINSNIAPIKFCLSDLENAETIKIDKAQKAEIGFSGITGIESEYTGADQKIAVGDLSASITRSRYNITNEIAEAKFLFVRESDLGDGADWVPDVNAAWKSWSDVRALYAGKYQLFVYLTKVSNNIDTSVPLIYPLFAVTNYAEITPATMKNLEIVAPHFAENLVYNGLEQALIDDAFGATLAMKNGNEILEGKGAVKYYISSSRDNHLASAGTLHGGAAIEDFKNGVKEQHVGTYYIWAEFEAGTSYDAIDATLIGVVTIGQATEKNIELSGLNFTTHMYDGEEHDLALSGVTQTFKGGSVLTNKDDYETVQYGYSNDANVAPTTWYDNYTDLKASDAGKYYIWINVTGKVNTTTNNKNVADYFKCYFDGDHEDDYYTEIYKNTLTNKDFDGVIPHTELVYIGQNQILASLENGGLRITLSSDGVNLNDREYNTDLTFYWGLGSGNGGDHGTNASDAPVTDITMSNWFGSIEDVRAIDAREYYLWIWMPESKNFAEYKGCIAVITIGKAVIEFTQKPLIYENEDKLIYDGSYQSLLRSEPVAKFYAEGAFYEDGGEYYDAIGVMLEYSLPYETGVRPVSDFRDITRLNANTYTVNYKVVAATNGNWDEYGEDIQVKIWPVDASTDQIGLAVAPKALEDLHYNEDEQALIDYGRLSDDLMEVGCGAALEGCKIIFYYAEHSNDRYEYYYDKDSGKYVWGENGELPGRVEANEHTDQYHIKYYVTESTTGNYSQSSVKDLYITIHKREVWWDTTPDAIHGIKYVGKDQQALTPGILNVGVTGTSKKETVPLGVTVNYTLAEPGTTRGWTDSIPTVNAPGLWYIWYYLECDTNNVFVGSQNNNKEEGEMLVVLVERYILTIRNMPETTYLMYNGEEQSLVSFAALSTDDVDSFGDKAPYFEYSLNKGGPFTPDIKRKARGTYTVYYRLNYDPAIFDFRGETDGKDEPMQLVVVIDAKEMDVDSVRAVFEWDDDGGKVGYKATRFVYNESTGEIEEVPSYTEEFIAEFEKHIKYYYRLYDKYNQNAAWVEWKNNETYLDRTKLGTYQFKLIIDDWENAGDLNFNYYEQAGVIPYDTYVVTEDRTIEIVMQDYSSLAYVRAWIDMTGTMTYDEAEYSYEAWVNNNGRFEIRFYDVNSTGRNHHAVIRLQTINASYYYISATTLTATEKSRLVLQTSDVKNAIRSFNDGLEKTDMTVYLYEVYRIQYDANGGTGGTTPAEGWKWHKIRYQLEENNFKKITENGWLEPNGWNTSRAGNGNNYGSGSMYYTDDASQIFYANFFSGDNYYTIEWVITDGVTTYALSRDSEVWFDISQEPTRARGMKIAEGDFIVLPQVEMTGDGQSLSAIFNGFILGWGAVADNWQPETDNKNRIFRYEAGMKANRNIKFVADLNNNDGGLNNYVEARFENDIGEVVHESGRVANGASAYMALSGMSANTIRNYYSGYTDWVHKYAPGTLKREDADPNYVITYNFGAKEIIPVDPETTETPRRNGGEYAIMAVILILGLAAAAASLVLYIYMRKKRHQVKSV